MQWENARRSWFLVECCQTTPLRLALISIRISQWFSLLSFFKIQNFISLKKSYVRANRFNYNKNNKHLSAVDENLSSHLHSLIWKWKNWKHLFISINFICFKLRQNKKSEKSNSRKIEIERDCLTRHTFKRNLLTSRIDYFW